MRHVVMSAAVDRHLSQSEDVIYRLYNNIIYGMTLYTEQQWMCRVRFICNFARGRGTPSVKTKGHHLDNSNVIIMINMLYDSLI